MWLGGRQDSQPLAGPRAEPAQAGPSRRAQRGGGQLGALRLPGRPGRGDHHGGPRSQRGGVDPDQAAACRPGFPGCAGGACAAGRPAGRGSRGSNRQHRRAGPVQRRGQQLKQPPSPLLGRQQHCVQGAGGHPRKVIRAVRTEPGGDVTAREPLSAPDRAAAALPGLRAFAIPMRTRFRGITVREGALLEGPAGLGRVLPVRRVRAARVRPLAGLRAGGGVGRLARAGARRGAGQRDRARGRPGARAPHRDLGRLPHGQGQGGRAGPAGPRRPGPGGRGARRARPRWPDPGGRERRMGRGQRGPDAGRAGPV